MSFEAAHCPHCGATIQVPTDRVTARCMICGGEVDVQTAIKARRNSAATGSPNWKDVLQVALEYIDSGNHKEADAQLTRILEHEPTNGAVWMCKALISVDPDQLNSYAQKAFNLGFAASERNPALARRFADRGVALIGLSDDADDGLEIERNSASGYIDEAHRQAFAAAVNCDFAYQYLALAFALLSVSYELAPAADIADALSLMETLVNYMPAAGRVIDSADGYPYRAKAWFHHTLPAVYELRQRIRRDFPEAEVVAPFVPNDLVRPPSSVVPRKLMVGLLGFAFTFGIGLLRGERIEVCVAIGIVAAILTPLFTPANK